MQTTTVQNEKRLSCESLFTILKFYFLEPLSNLGSLRS